MASLSFLLSVIFVAMIIALIVAVRRLQSITAQLMKASDRAEAAEHKSATLRDHFKPITSLEDEQARLIAAIDVSMQQITDLHCEAEEKQITEETRSRAGITAHETQMTELRETYQEKKAIYNRMLAEIALFDE